MKREDLKKLGIEDSLVDSIMALHGTDIEKHKTDLATAQTELGSFKTQLTEAGATIEGFKKLDVDGIKAAADEWKTKAEKAASDGAATIASLKFDHALEKALADAKVKDSVAVRAHLKPDMLKLGEDGAFIGLKEQLDPLKSSKDYLFESDTPTPKIITGGNSKSILGDPMADAMRKAAGLPMSGEK
ncbi:MAG: phage scaffolding protein [Chloroflexi bacterium]|nr:phage scaffolding protein [Chloroflexota bacterium]